MGEPLKNPPVYFTVAQVRFNMLLKLADYLPLHSGRAAESRISGIHSPRNDGLAVLDSRGQSGATACVARPISVRKF